MTISRDDCDKVKDCLKTTAKYGAMGACFGAGYAARSMYDAMTGYGSGGSKKDDDYSTTTGSPFRSSGLGSMNDSYLDRLNGGKIY